MANIKKIKIGNTEYNVKDAISGYITGINSTDVTNALGYTPYDASNPSGYTSNVGTVTSVNNTSPDGNGNVSISIPSEVTETTVSNWGFTKNTGTVTSVNNVSPVNGNVSLSIPTVNNPTITITQGGVTKGSFTLNQSTGDTIALDAGGGSSLPSQTGNAGKFLTTDGTDASWGVPKTHNLFDFIWRDAELNDQSWLRADTFSWQDGTVYSDAYNHLVDDLGTIEQTTHYAWKNGSTVVYTTSEIPSMGDPAYSYTDGSFIQVDTVKIVIVGNIQLTQQSGVFARDTSSDIGGSSSSGATQTTETIGSYTITYWLAIDGHKICLPDQETTALNIYNESGVAWYYILDTTNQRFKLPRSSHGNIVEKYQNGPQWYRVYSDGWCEQGGNFTTSASWVQTTITFLKSYKDSNYSVSLTESANYFGGDSSTIESKSSSNMVVWMYNGTGVATWKTCGYISSYPSNDQYKYLYFYVGQFSQSATEQTAGLNSELFNGKVDLDAGNLSTAGKSLISGLGMPSGRYDDLTLGASGSTYTAPANGYFCLMKNSNAGGQNIALNNNTNPGLSSFATNSATTQALRCFIPVHKNDIMVVGYTAGGAVQWFRFYYAEGEPSV